MRLVEIQVDRNGGRSQPRILVHGSCRIHGPFDSLAEDGRALLVMTNLFAVSHTLGEIEQVLEFFRGRREIPGPLAKYVFEDPSQVCSLRPRERQILDSVDAVVVEVSLLRQLRFRDTYFQFNVFMDKFMKPFGAAVLPWFRALSAGRPVTDELVGEALAAIEDKGAPAGDLPLIAEILREMRLETLSLKDVIRGIRSITEGSPARWIFVSHFVAPGLSGTVMKDRIDLQTVLRAATKECGVDFFDPSDVIEHKGRELALANGGADVHHYAPEFQATVAREILKRLQPVVPALVPSFPETGVAAADRPGSVRSVAKDLNVRLGELHRLRVEELGVEQSGLYEHYLGLMKDGRILARRDTDIAELVLRYLPKFETYHVLRAGLGEIAFLLSAHHEGVKAYDPIVTRHGAILAGADYLRRSGYPLGRTFATSDEVVPDADQARGACAIATQLLFNCSPEEEEPILQRLEAYDAILFNPAALVRSRPDPGEREKLLARFHRAGFAVLKEYPHLDAVFCCKEGALLPQQQASRARVTAPELS